MGTREHCAQLPKDWRDIQYRMSLFKTDKRKTERWLKNPEKTIVSFAWWPPRRTESRSIFAKQLGPLAGLQCTPCCSHPSPSTIAWWHINFISGSGSYQYYHVLNLDNCQWMPENIEIFHKSHIVLVLISVKTIVYPYLDVFCRSLSLKIKTKFEKFWPTTGAPTRLL